jgi:hypothetical protein
MLKRRKETVEERKIEVKNAVIKVELTVHNSTP